jgi:benzoyl-CoA reductase/2-hydroxyglutaryl-CoA dehydratase subunit BcrC/BadD/HgdB
VSDRAFYRLVRSREYLPPEEFRRLADAAFDTANGAERRGTPIVVSGIVPEPMEVLDALGDAGAVVVGDDFAAVGRRVYPAGTSDAPLRRMAERLMNGPPDSTRGSDVGERVRHLVKLAETGGAKAVLFFVVKFCEPELFYLPQMRAELEKSGLRSIVIEADVTDALPHQAVTRVEALMETVS